jgi:hypothetical protein
VLIDCDRGTNKQTRQRPDSIAFPSSSSTPADDLQSLKKVYARSRKTPPARATERAPATFLLGAKLSPERERAADQIYD